MGASSTIYFVRHGHYNIGFMTPYDAIKVPLTMKGIEDIDILAEKMSIEKIQPTAIYTSAYLRAKQTADILSDVLKAEVQEVEELKEATQGESEMHNFESMHRRYHSFTSKLLKEKPGVHVIVGHRNPICAYLKISSGVLAYDLKQDESQVKFLPMGGSIKAAYDGILLQNFVEYHTPKEPVY